MPIDPWLAEKFELIRDIPSFDAALGDPQYGARFMQYLEDPAPWAPPAGVTAEDRTTAGGRCRVKVFRPAARRRAARCSGCTAAASSWARSTTPSPSSPASELAARAGAVVVSVGYRLAVDGVRYPAPLDDAMAAWHWLAEHAAGARRRPRAGSSSAARASAPTSRPARRCVCATPGEPMPRGMLLAYPLEHFPTPPTRARRRAPSSSSVPAMLRFPEQYQLGIVHNYLGRVDDLPADVVPGNFPVDGLPEAWIAPERVRRPAAVRRAVRPAARGGRRRRRTSSSPAAWCTATSGAARRSRPVAATLDFFADGVARRADGPSRLPLRLPGEAAARVPAPAPHPRAASTRRSRRCTPRSCARPSRSPFADIDHAAFRRIRPGTAWGKVFDCAWLRITGEVPAGIQNPVVMLGIGGEGLVYSPDGRGARLGHAPSSSRATCRTPAAGTAR